MPSKKLIFGIYIYQTSDLFLCSLALELGWATYMGVCQDGSFNIENEFFVRCLASQIFFCLSSSMFFACLALPILSIVYLLDCIVWGNRKQLHIHSHAVTVHTHHHINTLPHHTCLPSQSSPFFITIGSRYVILSLIQQAQKTHSKVVYFQQKFISETLLQLINMKSYKFVLIVTLGRGCCTLTFQILHFAVLIF